MGRGSVCFRERQVTIGRERRVEATKTAALGTFCYVI